MIDWDKPIQAIDGRAAKLLSRGYWRNGETYCVVQVENPETGNSDILIVNPTSGWGHAAMAESSAQISNVPVKREGWVVARHYNYKDAAPLLERRTLYPSEAAARAACVLKYQFPMFVSWEE